jgi:putative membrane protein
MLLLVHYSKRLDVNWFDAGRNNQPNRTETTSLRCRRCDRMNGWNGMALPDDVRVSWPVLTAALSVTAGTGLAAPWLSLGPMSSQMAIHIATMNVAAPLVAVLDGWWRPHRHVAAGRLWAAAACQIAALWAWHLPSTHHAGASSAIGAIVMHASLFATSLWFWSSVVRLHPPDLWHGILALLATGKLSCLLGGLLVFAPRSILDKSAPGYREDQQLAGLLMIAACPASYVVAGVLAALRFVGLFPAPVRHLRSS